jgi:choline dehydrogenase-like flavoprotein
MGKKIVVIGSGLAGSLICNVLIEGCDVTLLEKGRPDKIAYPAVDFMKKHFGVVKTFCIGEGGTTNIWDNGLIPINPHDVLSETYRRVLHDAGRYPDKAAGGLFLKHYSAEYDAVCSEMSRVASSIGAFTDGVDCLLYPKNHKGLRVSSKVKTVYNVSDLDVVAENGRVRAVVYLAEDGRQTVETDCVVVCAGALGTPRIVNKILTAFGFSVERVGTGLADHPMGFVGKIKVRHDFQKQIQQMALRDKGDYICRTAIRLKSECGRYTCCAFFRPAVTMQNKISIHKYKSLLGASRGGGRIKNAFSWKLFHPDILAEIYSHVFSAQIPGRVFNILMLFEQKRGSSRVYYEGSRIKVDWRITDEEMDLYNAVLKKLHGMLLPISEKLVIQSPLTEEWLWSAAHHSGTISLGSESGSLVDENLRLKSCENVFVCDGSVIQEHSYANTGLTIGQLGMRLAEHIMKKDMA